MGGTNRRLGCGDRGASDAGQETCLELNPRTSFSLCLFPKPAKLRSAKEGILRLRRSSEDYEKRIEQMAENDLYDSYKQKHGAAIESRAQKDVEEGMRQKIRHQEIGQYKKQLEAKVNEEWMGKTRPEIRTSIEAEYELKLENFLG